MMDKLKTKLSWEVNASLSLAVSRRKPGGINKNQYRRAA